MAFMSTDETAEKENGLVGPGNAFKEFWPILVPTQHIPLCGQSSGVGS